MHKTPRILEMKGAKIEVQDALIDKVRVSYNNRVSQQVLDCMRGMVDHTYLTDLIDALDGIADLTCIPDGWDSELVTNYPVKPFKYGSLEDMHLWHAHFPLSGSTRQVISSNLLKKKRFNAFINEICQKKHVDKNHIEKVTGRNLEKIIGLNEKQSPNITSDWLVFLPTPDGNQYLCACEHLNTEEEEVLALGLKAEYPRYFNGLSG